MIDGMTPSSQGLAGSFDQVAASGGKAATGLDLNPDTYLPMLEGYDLTDQQARELLAALWQIMRGFVELGIRVDVCGELGLDALPVLTSDAASVDSNDPTNT